MKAWWSVLETEVYPWAFMQKTLLKHTRPGSGLPDLVSLLEQESHKTMLDFAAPGHDCIPQYKYLPVRFSLGTGNGSVGTGW